MERIFIIASPLLFLLFSSISCTKNKAKSQISLQKKIKIKPPIVVAAGEPLIINLDSRQKPYRFLIPVKDSVKYSVKTKEGVRPKIIYASETKPANFFVTMEKFGTDEGLLVPAARCCFLDKRGVLWVGTQGGGVTSYDGKSVISFTSDLGLGNNTVRCILEDDHGNMWFGCEGGGISKYDGRSIISFTSKQGLVNNEVRDITIDNKGCLWIATRYGISQFDGKRFKNFTTSEGLISNDVECCITAKNGNIWFATPDGVSCYDGKSFINFTTAEGLVNNSIVCIKEDRQGNLWFGGRRGGVSMYNGKTFNNFTNPELARQSIHCIAQDRSGKLWFGTYRNGVLCYDGKTFTNLSTKQGLADDIVHDIAEDKSGNLWIATFGGVSCYPGNAFVSYSRAEGLPDNTVRNVIESKRGNYWIATNSGGICNFHDNLFTIFNNRQGLNHSRIHRIYQDNTGNLWFCTGDGVSRYDGKSIINFNTDQGIPFPAVRCILQDREGNMWFGTEIGLSKFDGKSFSNFSSQQGMPYNNVRDMVHDEDGNLWLGFSTQGGISRYDGKTFINLDTAQGLTDIDITSMTTDSKGNIWIGTGNHGVNILRRAIVKKFQDINAIEAADKLFEKLTTDEGLSDNVVWDIVEDRVGNIIIGTNSGLTVIKGGLDTQQPISREKIEWYNRKTGYPVKDVNTQAMYVDSGGTIWAGTGEQLVRFDYSALHKDSIPPEVRIQGLKINNEKVGWFNLLSKHRTEKREETKANGFLPAITTEEAIIYGKKLTQKERDSMQRKFSAIRFDSIMLYYPVPANPILPYRFNNVTFDFAAIEPAKPQLVRYQYILEGYDKDWSPVTDLSTASFGNIYEGKYVFKVKAMSPEGVWSKPVSFSFTVLPPYWRSWWFRSIYITALIVLLFSLIKLRIRAVRKNEQKKIAHEKELLEMEARALRAQMNPHFIFNCLNSIKALIQQHETDKGVTYLTTFSKLIRTLFHNSDKRQISLYDEIETCKLYTQLEAMRLNGKLKYNFNIDPNLDLKSVMVPALIVQPFIENAIWHGIVPKEDGAIDVSIKGNEEAIICEVDDNGIGREMSRLNKPITPVLHESKGVHLSQQRLKVEKTLNDTNASIEIIDKYENDQPTGTRVVLTFFVN